MKRLVLVEDDAWLADSYRHVLTQAGYDVRAANDAHAAIRLIEDARPDCIVADMLLEGHTVLGLLHELQSYDDTASVPIVLCSALTHPGLRLEQLRHYGVRAMLDKATLTPDRLVQTIAEVLV